MLWSLLPYADQGLKSKSALLQGRFTGDPAFEYEHSVTHRVGEGDSAQEQTTAVSPQHDGAEIIVHSACICRGRAWGENYKKNLLLLLVWWEQYLSVLPKSVHDL